MSQEMERLDKKNEAELILYKAREELEQKRKLREIQQYQER